MSLPSSPGSAERERFDEYLVSRCVINRRPVAVLVDAFRGVGKCRASIERQWEPAEPARVVYFLSHFHSDHYAGLSPTVAATCGVVYASRPSAALLVSQLHVPQEAAFAMDFGRRYCFSLVTGQLLSQSGSGCAKGPPEDEDEEELPNLLPAGTLERDVFYVRLIPANHCPGAAMLLFTSAAFGSVLHTGDFRFSGSEAHWRRAVQLQGWYWGAPPLSLPPSAGGKPPLLPPAPFYETFIEDDPALRRVAGRVEALFLDNTFCDPAFEFESQWHATQHVVGMLRSLCQSGARDGQQRTAPSDGTGEAGSPPESVVNCALLVGTYSIGKERVAFAVQEAFALAGGGGGGFVPVYVTPSKFARMQDIGLHAKRFQPLGTPAASLERAALGSASLTADEQPLLCDWDSAAASSTSPSLVEVLPAPYEVLLPEKVTLSSDQPFLSAGGGDGETASSEGGVGAESEGEGGTWKPKTRFLLTILLVPLGSVGYPAMAAASGRLLKRRRSGGANDAPPNSRSIPERPLLDVGEGLGLDLSRYDRVLGVEPTGWARKPKSQRVTDATWLLKVPYSEHCAFHEMLSFVGFVNPARVVPTVSFEQFKKHEPLFVERAPRLSSRWANTQPLSRFFTPAAARRQGGASTGPSASSTTSRVVTNEERPVAPPPREAKPNNPFATKACSRAARETAAVQASVRRAQGMPDPPRRQKPPLATSDSTEEVPPSHPLSDSGGCVIVAVRHAVVVISDSDSDGDDTLG